MFFDVFSALCWRNGKSKNAAALEMGFSNAIVTKWKKKGATPNVSTLSTISKYFDVPVEFLLGVGPKPMLLVTEHQLALAKKAYDKEKDPAKKAEFGTQCDLLQESLEDQRFQISVEKEKTAAKIGDGLSDTQLALIESVKRMSEATAAAFLASAQLLEAADKDQGGR